MPRPVEPPVDIRAPGATMLSALVAAEIDRPLDDARALLALGAVYVNRDRVREDRPLAEGDYVRVHENPRRYFAGRVDWDRRLVTVTDDYVIVDKPSGLPVHPTCDNAAENVIAQVSAHLGQTLYIVQRLDVGTQGLMALARSGGACRRFNEFLNQGRVAKRYRALVERPLRLGELLHYMMPADRAPRLLSPEAREGWKECRLVVEATRRLDAVHEVTIRLLTGRMHQIRAQLAAVGAPLLGDTLYGSSLPADGEAIPLQSCRLEFPAGRFELPSPWG